MVEYLATPEETFDFPCFAKLRQLVHSSAIMIRLPFAAINDFKPPFNIFRYDRYF